MSQSNLTVLGIVAAVMVVLAIAVGSWDRTASFDDSGIRYLVDEFNTSDIGSIEVAKGDDEARLVRAGKGFVVASKHNYPAAFREINSAIRKFTTLRTTALLTSDAGDHGDLGVAADSEGVQVLRLFDRDGKPIVSLFANEAEGEQGTAFNLRLDGDDRVYRTDEWIAFNADDLAYIAKDLVSIERDEIRAVSIRTGADDYRIDSPENGDIALMNVPEGQRAKQSDVESVFGAAAGLTFTDFRSEVDATDLSFDSTYTVETRSQAVYTFEIAKKVESSGEGDAATDTTKYFVRCVAKYAGPADITIARDEEQAELEKKEALLLARDAVDEFNQKHQSWVYELSSWKAEQMVKAMGDLVEEDDGKPTEVTASHILIAWEGSERSEVTGRTKEEARERAELVLGKVEAGDDFAELAKEFSDGPSGPNGGAMPPFKFEDMAEAFSEAAFALEVGATSGIVETPFGFHVIRRTK